MPTLPKVAHVARYILDQRGPVTAWKLQKLVYYAQAWSLVWDERPLFDSEIEAWANGPVCRDLFSLHKGKFEVSAADIDGDPSILTPDEIETLEAVLGFYGDRPSQWLSDLTHNERPWREAREGIPPGEKGSRVISWEAMSDYYSSLY